MEFDIKRIKELRKKLGSSTIDLPDPVQAFWHDVKNERPPARKNVLMYKDDGDIAEGVYLGDGTWTQFRWSATLKGKVIKWGYLSDLLRVGTEENIEKFRMEIYKILWEYGHYFSKTINRYKEGEIDADLYIRIINEKRENTADVILELVKKSF